MNVFKAHIDAVQRYRSEPYAGRICFFQASEPDIRELGERASAWETLALDGIARYTVPGNHQTIIAEPHVHRLAEHLKACFVAVQAST